MTLDELSEIAARIDPDDSGAERHRLVREVVRLRCMLRWIATCDEGARTGLTFVRGAERCFGLVSAEGPMSGPVQGASPIDRLQPARRMTQRITPGPSTTTRPGEASRPV